MLSVCQSENTWNPGACTYVIVKIQFYPWFKLYVLLFWGRVLYDNEFETKENKILTGIKSNHNIILDVYERITNLT